MNSIYSYNMNRLMIRNYIHKIAYDMNLTPDEVVQRIRDNTDELVRQWKEAVKQSKGER